jgi:hypothetical protein
VVFLAGIIFASIFWAFIGIYLHNQSSAASVKKYLPADAEEVRESFRHALIPGSDATLWLRAKVSPEGAQAFAKQMMPEGRTIDRSANWAQLNAINDSLMHSHGEPRWFDPPANADSSLAIDQTAASDLRFLKFKPPYLYYYRRFRP